MRGFWDSAGFLVPWCNDIDLYLPIIIGLPLRLFIYYMRGLGCYFIQPPTRIIIIILIIIIINFPVPPAAVRAAHRGARAV